MINEIEFLKSLLDPKLIWAWQMKEMVKKRIAAVVADVSINPYTQARHIYYGFNIGDSGIFTVEVRSCLMVLQNRCGREKKFKTQKDAGGIRITRIS